MPPKKKGKKGGKAEEAAPVDPKEVERLVSLWGIPNVFHAGLKVGHAMGGERPR